MTLKYNYTEPNPSRIYSDVNISLTPHPISLDFSRKTGDNAIKQALRNLILLNRGEKPFHPEIGGGIYDMLFENYDLPGGTDTLRYTIASLIHKYEPRVELTRIDIDANPNSNSLSINIYYIILNTLIPSNVEIFLKTIR